MSIVALTSCFKDKVEPRTFEEQLEIDIEKIETYLSNNDLTATKLESGVFYNITLEGAGESPTVNGEITVRYQGRLLSGKIFDEVESTNGLTINLSQLIDAWQFTVPLMKVGGTMTIYSPSGYGYGNVRISTVPPNSVLIFDIELISFE
ncbi:MAG: FKBP-type peptidyl-prolyl cis-trans isomerase [Cyclobacteriaceae bacterium]